MHFEKISHKIQSLAMASCDDVEQKVDALIEQSKVEFLLNGREITLSLQEGIVGFKIDQFDAKVNYSHWLKKWRKEKNKKSRGPLYQSLGKTKNFVLDATGGLFFDSLKFLSWGVPVISLEQSPVLAIVGKAVTRSLSLKYFEVFHCDFFNLSLDLKRNGSIYIDPMYHNDANQKSAPNKRAQLLRVLSNEKVHETKRYLSHGISMEPKRVILKRPIKSPILLKPDQVIEGKAVRYDGYLCHL